MLLHLDCRHYRGDRPCRFERPCEDCPHYTPMGPRVLIVKLGALGDVVRTSCLLPSMAAWDDPPWVTWVTSAAAFPLVHRMPGVHRALVFDSATLMQLQAEQFDLVLSLDKEAPPCALAMNVTAGHRLGIGLSRYGTPYPLNEECEYYFRLGIDNEEKFFGNAKTHQQLLHEALGWTYDGQGYAIELTLEDRSRAAERLYELGVPRHEPLIGINPGAGSVFANKAWREEGYVELIGRLRKSDSHLRILLLGGPEERDALERLAAAAGRERVFHPGCDLPLGPFAGLIEQCAVVVSGDTLAMHLALALRSRSVAIFGPTCAQEIDMLGRGERIVTTIGCAPCYRRQCDKNPTCQDAVTVDEVFEAAMRQLAAANATSRSLP